MGGNADALSAKVKGRTFGLVSMQHVLEHCLNTRPALCNATSFLEWNFAKMAKSIVQMVEKVRREGLRPIVQRRARSYWIQVALKYQNSPVMGRLVELMGNRARIDGMVFSLDSPSIETFRKGSFVFGLHESEERTLVKQWLPGELPVVEFGGGIGVVTCLANRKLVRPELHIVVEANPKLVPLLERNRDLNGCGFQILNKALAYDAETVEFHIHTHFLSGRADGAGGTAITVPTTSLKAIIDGSGFDQISVICDVEGTETMLVEQEIETLRQHVQFLLVEVHPQFTGEQATGRMVQRLETAGFVIKGQIGTNLALSHK